MALIYFLSFIGIISAIICIWAWIGILRHPEQA